MNHSHLAFDENQLHYYLSSLFDEGSAALRVLVVNPLFIFMVEGRKISCGQSYDDGNEDLLLQGPFFNYSFFTQETLVSLTFFLYIFEILDIFSTCHHIFVCWLVDWLLDFPNTQDQREFYNFLLSKIMSGVLSASPPKIHWISKAAKDHGSKIRWYTLQLLLSKRKERREHSEHKLDEWYHYEKCAAVYENVVFCSAVVSPSASLSLSYSFLYFGSLIKKAESF